MLAGRYRDGGPAAVTLTGDVNGTPREFRYDDLTFRSEGGDAFIARLWATRKVGYLLNEIRLRGANQELVDEVVRLATQVRHRHALHLLLRARAGSVRTGAAGRRRCRWRL